MNFRERFVNTMQFKPVDQIPCIDFGYWWETIQRWHTEGLPEECRSNSQVEDYLGLDRGYLPWRKDFDPHIEFNEVLYLEANWLPYAGDIYPPFPAELLSEDENHTINRSPLGFVYRQNKGMQSMPEFLEFPVKTMADWQKIVTRLDGKDPARYPSDWRKKVEQYKTSEKPLSLYISGFFGMARNMMGLENLSYAYYDQPELVSAMAEHHTQFLMDAYDRVTNDLEIDLIVTFEDMCYNSGPLISPNLFKQFLYPYYCQVTQFFKQRGVKTLMVDTDGLVIDIMELFLQAGMDGCLPCEVKAGSHPAHLRDHYPGIRLMGGVAKSALINGKKEIDAALTSLIPIMEAGGFIPTVDHEVPPDVSFENYRYFCDRRQELCIRYHP
jgi:uroporphyrinogen-III decarboxylase